MQLAPSSDRKEHFVHHLSKGPALLLFLPMKLQMCRVTQNILETVSCSCNIPYKFKETSFNVFFKSLSKFLTNRKRRDFQFIFSENVEDINFFR